MPAVKNLFRDEIYTRILLKKSLSQLSINNFTLEKTHIPYEDLADHPVNNPFGKVYVIAGTPGDISPFNRQNSVSREFAAMVGYQKADVIRGSVDEIDALDFLVEELETLCIKEVLVANASFSRLEYLKDANGVPFDYIGMRQAALYEAYFTVYYTLPIE